MRFDVCNPLQWYVNVYKRLIVAYIYELCATLKDNDNDKKKL